MGGRLNITSTLGKGTCLEVSLFFNILSPLGGKVLPVVQAEFEIVSEFQATARGAGGFGSSGRQ